MLADLATFLGRHEHTVAAVEAFSTLAAVIVSLALALLARRANYPRLPARMQKSVVAHPTLAPNYPSYITINITNTGILPLRVPLSFFYFRVPLRRMNWYPYPAEAGCPTVAGKRRTRAAPAGNTPICKKRMIQLVNVSVRGD
jgi:hypothetical protein